MKIAIINTFYKFGSTGTNAYNNYMFLRELGNTVRVYYARYRQQDGNTEAIYFGSKLDYYIHLAFGIFFGLQGSLSNLQTLRLIKYLDEFDPDVVWLNNIHGYYLHERLLWKYLKKSKCYIVYGMPDEYAYTGKCCTPGNCEKFKAECASCEKLREYPTSLFFDNSRRIFQRKKACYMDLGSRLIFRSAPYVIAQAKSSALTSKSNVFYENDSSVDVQGIFYPRETQNLRRQLGIPEDHLVVLTCAPIMGEVKGVRYLIKAARILKAESITFLNIGFGGPNNRRPDIDLSDLNYHLVPYITDKNTMAEYYSLADVYVCTSLSDAMPNACLEALGCGTPIIGFNNSGVPYVADEKHGVFIKPCDAEILASAINVTPKKTAERIKDCHDYALQRFDKTVSQRLRKEFIERLEAVICSNTAPGNERMLTK